MLRIRHCLCVLVFPALLVALVGGQTGRVRLAPELALPEPSPLLTTLHLPISSAPITLPQMTRASGTIFAGTVTAITRPRNSAGDAVSTVSVTFHVNRGMRGAVTGQDITIHQWIGLWTSGQQRYRIGEQVLLFLYPASKLGLTSCVASSLGRFTIDHLGRVLFSPQHLSTFHTDPVLGGKSSVSIRNFALAVRSAAGEEATAR